MLDTLAERFDVIAPDHPGFGASEVPGWIDDVSDVAYLYLDAIEKLGLASLHVVGQSLGGWIALEMAVRSTQRLRSLTLISSAGIHVKGVPKADIFMIDPEEQARLAYADPKAGDAAAERAAADKYQDQAILNRIASARFGWQPRFFNPRLERWLHRVNVPDPRDLGRPGPHHSARLWRGVPPPDPGLEAHHHSQRRPSAASRARRRRRQGHADVPAELRTAMKVMSFHLMPYADLDLQRQGQVPQRLGGAAQHLLRSAEGARALQPLSRRARALRRARLRRHLRQRAPPERLRADAVAGGDGVGAGAAHPRLPHRHPRQRLLPARASADPGRGARHARRDHRRAR